MGKRRRTPSRERVPVERRHKVREPDKVVEEARERINENIDKWEGMDDKRVQSIKAIETVVAKMGRVVAKIEERTRIVDEHTQPSEKDIIFYINLLNGFKGSATSLAMSIDDAIRAGFFLPKTPEDDFYQGVEDKKEAIALFELQAGKHTVPPLDKKNDEKT